MINKSKKQSGFTLTEMLVAVSLFVIIAFISIGAILTIFDANRKARSSKTVVDNLNLTIENMVRTIRFGTNYHCSLNGTLTDPRNCDNNAYNIENTYLQLRFNGDSIAYRKQGTAIEMSVNGGTFIPITSSDVVIERMSFYVFNTAVSDQLQPYVILVVKGYVGGKPSTKTEFSIQTFISQRALDI